MKLVPSTRLCLKSLKLYGQSNSFTRFQYPISFCKYSQSSFPFFFLRVWRWSWPLCAKAHKVCGYWSLAGGLITSFLQQEIIDINCLGKGSRLIIPKRVKFRYLKQKKNGCFIWSDKYICHSYITWLCLSEVIWLGKIAHFIIFILVNWLTTVVASFSF